MTKTHKRELLHQGCLVPSATEISKVVMQKKMDSSIATMIDNEQL